MQLGSKDFANPPHRLINPHLILDQSKADKIIPIFAPFLLASILIWFTVAKT